MIRVCAGDIPAAHAADLHGGELTLQRLLDLAYSVDGCHVVPEVRDDAALGRFYVENDFLSELEQVPDSVLELLDYAKIG